MGSQFVSPGAIDSNEAFGTSSIQQFISPSAISSAETFGSTEVDIEQFLLPGAISSAEAFGTTSLTRFLLAYGISTAEVFGGSVLTGALGPSLGFPLYTIYIGGVDRSQYVRAGSIRISGETGSRETASFEVYDPAGSYVPAIDDEVIIVDDSLYRMFAGLIEGTDRYAIKGMPHHFVSVKCGDFGLLCDRRIVGAHYTLFMGNSAPITIARLINTDGVLSGTGITYQFSWSPATALGEQVFNYITFTEVMNQICQKINGDWRVDRYKRLWIFPKETGYQTAPFSLADDDGNVLTDRSTGRALFVVSENRNRYYNRVGVRNSRDNRAIWIDSLTASAGQISFQTAYFQDVKPVVIENSVQQTVVEISQIGTTPYDYYYIENGIGVFRKTPATGGESVEVRYPSLLPWIYWVQDDAEVALYGKWEVVFEVKDFQDFDSLQVFAEGALARGVARPKTLSFTTKRNGLEPGQLLPVNYTRPPLVGDMLIESVSSTEVDKKYFLHQVRASNGQLQHLGSPNFMMTELLRRDKQPLDRILQRIAIMLAYDIPGLTNPGLAVGRVPGVGVVEKDGTLREVTIMFDSVNGGSPAVATTTDIEIDIYHNGVTIFGTDKLVFPAGATTLQRQWIFADEPYFVRKGDLITAEVLVADSLAKNGKVDLTIIG